MKRSRRLLLGGILWVAVACRHEPAPSVQSPLPPAPTPIGQGVEIYRARLEWMPFNRTVLLKSATILGDEPIIRYDDIIAYARYKPGERDPHQITIELTKRVAALSGQEASPTFGMPTVVYRLAPDSGFCVTVDKQLIYAGLYGNFSTVYGKDLIFRSVGNIFTSLNTLVVARDSIYTVNGQTFQQIEPDPRHDSRLLDRLRRDGKLKF